jgi:adenine-specific DNA-methyltransferase
MELNQEDDGNRRYVMVQLPEPIQSTKFSNLAEIGRERLKRVIGEKGNDRTDLLHGPGSTQALGFRAFKLDRSNFNIWEGASESELGVVGQIEMHIDHLSKSSSAEEILYELLLKAGFSLTTRVIIVELAKKRVFSIEDGSLLICLEREITPELIDALAEANPLQVICLDEGFKGNDQLKANAVQTFKARAEAAESEIVFKTV